MTRPTLRVVGPDGRTIDLDTRPRGYDGPTLLQAARNVITRLDANPSAEILWLYGELDVLRAAVEREERK